MVYCLQEGLLSMSMDHMTTLSNSKTLFLHVLLYWLYPLALKNN
jgi:hypothetical protein